MPLIGDYVSVRKTPLFEFDVPTYRKRAVGLAANNKQSR